MLYNNHIPHQRTMHTKNFYMQIIPGVDNAFGFGDTEDTYEQRQKGSDYSKVGGYGFASSMFCESLLSTTFCLCSSTG